jgi:hypothetical protein
MKKELVLLERGDVMLRNDVKTAYRGRKRGSNRTNGVHYCGHTLISGDDYAM